MFSSSKNDRVRVSKALLVDTLFAAVFTLSNNGGRGGAAVVADNGSGTFNTEFAGIMVDTEQKDSNVGDEVQSKRGVSTVKHHIYDFSLLCGDLDIDPIIDEPMDTPEEQRKKSRAGGGAPCESRKTVTRQSHAMLLAWRSPLRV